MEAVQTVIDQIPIRHNFASHLMFLGIVQMYFLSVVIFIRSTRDSATRLFGWSLLIQALVCTDTYLCYTGLMKYTLHWNDSTEVFVLLIAPSIYFFTYALLERKPITLKKHGIHFLLPLLYLISQIGYFMNPIEVKLNAYLDAYHETMAMVTIPEGVTYEYQIIKDGFRWLILSSFIFYLTMSAILVFKKGKLKKLPTQKVKIDKYTFTRITLVLLILLFVVVFGIYLTHEDDGGDHFIVLFVGAIAFISSSFVLSESRFFENSWLADRYETLSGNSIGIEKIEQTLLDDNYYLSSEITLKTLSKKLNLGANTLSKVINSESGMNFNDYINQKRVIEAKNRLLNENYAHLTIEAIGNSVGFNSKSAFYGAFKKHANTSPSAFVKENKVE